MAKNEPIKLSDHFSYRKLLRFVLAPVGTMLFTSIYTIVDGFFVSNYVGKTAFASLNLVVPYIMMIGSVGFMFGTGGSALVSMKLGMKENEKARSNFSLIVVSMTVIGILLSVISIILAPSISKIMGADEAMLPYCVLYLRINMYGIVFFMLQNTFQSFLITAEKPKIGFRVTLAAGFTNMFLDWLFVGVLDFGLGGAAWATILSQMIGAVIPFFFFIFNTKGILRLTLPKYEKGVISKTCTNGMSEFLSNVSASVVGFFFNLQLLQYAGENGVAAFGVIMYIAFVFAAIYIGYSIGTAPIISYHYGAENKDELKNLFKKSAIILLITNLVMFILSEALAIPFVKLFVGYDAGLFEMTLRGMQIYSFAYLIMGFNIFASAFFTALNNGVVSAILSVTRTLILELIMIYLMPALFGIDGLWAVTICVEFCGVLISEYFIIRNRKKYGYL